jgi:hypothetical protein
VVTRRQVLKAGGAAAALGAVGGCTPDGGGGEASGSDAAAAGDATGGTTTGVPASVAELPRLSFPEPGSGTGLNVIVIVVDTLRRDHVGVYGGDTQTPEIDALAADGLRFTRFLPETMPSVPVRRTVHSGRRAFPGADWAPVKGDFPLLAGWQPIPNTQPTMAETFAFAGYTTAIVADTPHLFKENMNYSRGFQTYRWAADTWATTTVRRHWPIASAWAATWSRRSAGVDHCCRPMSRTPMVARASRTTRDPRLSARR